MGFLTDITVAARAALAERPLDADRLMMDARTAPEPRNLAWTLRGYAEEEGVAVIAEVKRASPSAGVIAEDVDSVVQAMAYDVAGAAAISVLTEPRHFNGSLQDLVAVRRAVEHPVLRKDFLVHGDQVLEARVAGADSVLLITACLSDEELAQMLRAARDLGMEPLVEAHTDEDLDRALDVDAEIIGINSRNLETLEVDFDAALSRLRRVPDDRVAVLESGISGEAHVRAAVREGASAILVGEALMRSADPSEMLRRLVGAANRQEQG